MMRVRTMGLVAAVLGAAGVAQAQEIQAGRYLCTTEQRAGIGGIHLEGADPPSSFIDDAPFVKFRIEIVRGPGYVVTELPYDGSGADRSAWHTPNAVLHSQYLGDGRSFTASEDQAFLRMGPKQKAGSMWFWHSGFEYPGGEDTNLSVRIGSCAKEG
jgi:hypothetical protein